VQNHPELRTSDDTVGNVPTLAVLKCSTPDF